MTVYKGRFWVAV